MKKIICLIFGHNGYTYNGGTQENPEQHWACSFCESELEYGDYFGLEINYKVVPFIQGLFSKKDKNIDLPF